MNNINFVGMYDVGDEEFILGKEKTVEVPETGESAGRLGVLSLIGVLCRKVTYWVFSKLFLPQNYPGDKVTNLMELTDDGALKTTTKKGNGVNIRVMKVITILSTLNLTLNYEKNIFLEKFPASSL